MTIKNGEPTTMSYLAVLRKGSLGDLGPLRVRLNETITPEILRLVADGARDGRKLYVGVVDADTGEAEALDLTDMAQRYAAATTSDDQAAAHDCYIEAVVASSSAPLAAAPVFIDNRMLIDGGARFGMFAIAFEEAARDYQAAKKDKDVAPVTFLIINGTQATSQQCGKLDPAQCTIAEPTGTNTGAHASWSFTKLALRSEGILSNQVYRFSEERLGSDARFFRVTRIAAEADAHLFTMDNSALGTGEKKCSEWHSDDQRINRPVQFYPRYMHCLIDYGRVKGAEAKWSAALDLPPAPSIP